jgi:regulation of enolase protein 1 (concanavalin A-like superfamily)
MKLPRFVVNLTKHGRISPFPHTKITKFGARKKSAEKVGIEVSFILMRPHLPWERKLHFNNNINMILDN